MSDGFFNNPKVIKELTDLSEIQPYLPDNHPDKIKSMSKEDLLAEAKRKYPIGTKFKCVESKDIVTLDSFDTIYKNHWITDTYLIVSVKDYVYKGHYIYSNGQWAEIVESKQPDLSELYNCYIPLENEDQYNQITKWLESKGFKFLDKFSHSFIIVYNNKSFGSYSHSGANTNKKLSIQDLSKYGFQYNTKTEKPFDTNKKEESKDLTGRWLKCKEWNGVYFKAGNYYQLLEGKGNNWWDYKVKDKEGYLDTINGGIFELMPEGFIPNTNTISTTNNYGVISSTESIDVGDEVESNCPNAGDYKGIIQKGIVIEVDKTHPIQPCLKIETSYNRIWHYPQYSGDYIKLIKKAQTTTHIKKVDERLPYNIPQTTTLLRFENEDELLDTSIKKINSVKTELLEI